jgi:hypothetical protein
LKPSTPQSFKDGGPGDKFATNQWKESA